ncbi:hypothetical protein M9434_001299 [Picochlorum sp. BPE23]|nr:hypothetical protein M9434_001299 [Picochlorum sp. BPE23]
MEGTTTLSAEEGSLLCQGGYVEKGEERRMPLSKDEVAPALTPGSVPEVQQGTFGEDALPSNLHQIHAGKSDHTSNEPLIASSEENLSDGMNLLNMTHRTGMDGGSPNRVGMAKSSNDGTGTSADEFSGAHETEGGGIGSNRMVPQFSRSLPTVGCQGIISSEASMFSSSQSDSPTRFLWIGNLTPMATRPVLCTIFERFGPLEDLIAFPSRMYAFVTYQHTESAVKALQSIQGVVIKDITGEKGMIIKYRPERKAATQLMDESSGRSHAGADVDVEPSPRIWLGNIAPTATAANLQSVLGRFGPLVDAAVFPARIGPLGYAFVKFERLEDAINAYTTLNNAVVPALSGSKQVKMRYKPVTEGVPARDTALDALQASIPSRHIWIGNVTQKPSEEVLMRIFSRFGTIESARVFSAKSYAFVNFYEISSAIEAITKLDGVAVPVLTGLKPLVMRYQHDANAPSNSANINQQLNNKMLEILSRSRMVPDSQQSHLRSQVSLPQQMLAQSFSMHVDNAAQAASTQHQDQLRFLGQPLPAHVGDSSAISTVLQNLAALAPAANPAPPVFSQGYQSAHTQVNTAEQTLLHENVWRQEDQWIPRASSMPSMAQAGQADNVSLHLPDTGFHKPWDGKF